MSPPPGFPPPALPPDFQAPGPPAGFPPYSGPAPLPAPKKGFVDQFKAMLWWEKVLVILPLTLLGIGGLIGGLFGGGASAINTTIARSSLSAAARASLMVGVAIAAYVLYFVAAAIIFTALRSSRG